MHANVLNSEEQNDRFGQGMAGAIVLHVLLVAAIAGFAVWGHFHDTSVGETADVQGAIQASMVSAIPLPTKAQPVAQQVLAPEDTSAAAAPPPKEATAPPPKPTDVQIKAKTEKPTKVAPVQQPTPQKHPQPTPDTTKAQMGQEATQLAQSTTPVGSGSATATILDKVAGQRYSYYAGIISRKVAGSWYKGEADPRASLDRTATVLFDVDTDGTPENIRIEVRSGSPTLDQSALRAVQRISSFGVSPMGHTITVEFKFLYAAP
jgi:protein TonB